MSNEVLERLQLGQRIAWDRLERIRLKKNHADLRDEIQRMMDGITVDTATEITVIERDFAEQRIGDRGRKERTEALHAGLRNRLDAAREKLDTLAGMGESLYHDALASALPNEGSVVSVLLAIETRALLRALDPVEREGYVLEAAARNDVQVVHAALTAPLVK